MKKVLALLIMVCMAAVFCATAAAEDVIYAEHPLTTEETDFPTGTNEAAENYILRAFGLIGEAPRLRAAALSGNNEIVYNALADMARDVAAGTRSSTVCEIPVTSLLTKTSYTASDLGLSTLIEVADGEAHIAAAAVDAFYAEVEKAAMLNTPLVVSTLRSRMPYEMFWYGNICFYGFPGCRSDGTNIFFEEGAKYTVLLYVSQNYSVGGAANTTDYDTSYSQRVSTAAANAQAIVTANAGKTDYQKLDAYRATICNAVTYDHDAAENDDTPYGDPWQAVNVFDGDDSTNVVCEGYSKAFKYLCDLSSFRSPVSASLVSGTMAGATGAGPHMWNLVNMNGTRYLVDVTNCDEGSIGAPDKLFMAGYYQNYSDGEDWGYQYLGNGNTVITYVYGQEMADLYSVEELTVSNSDYIPPAECESHTWNNGFCTVCGYECPHTNKTTVQDKIFTEYEWRSTSTHAVRTIVASHPVCQNCGWCGEIVKQLNQETLESHTDSNEDGVCDLCGYGIAEHIDFEVENGVLTIGGQGTIENYASGDATPWASDRGKIKRIIIGKNITGIGEYAFAGFTDPGLRVEFNQSALPDIAANSFAGTTAVCRYFTDDTGWPGKNDTTHQYSGTLTWFYLPINVPDGDASVTGKPILSLEYKESGWTVYVEDELGHRTVSMTAEQVNETAVGRHKGIGFYAIPTTAEDQSVYTGWDDVSHISMEYECTGNLDVSLKSDSVLKYISVSNPDCILNVTDPRAGGLYSMTVSNGTVNYTGNIQELILQNGSEDTGHPVYVSGDVDTLNFYEKTAANQYRGSLTVGGTIRKGYVWGSGTLDIPGAGETNVGNMVKASLENVHQTAPVIVDGELNVAGTTPITLSTDMFTFDYSIYRSEKLTFGLTLYPKQEYYDTVGSNAINCPELDIGLSDIVWGDDTGIGIECSDDDLIELNGKTDEEGHKTGLSRIDVHSGHVKVNCPVEGINVCNRRDASESAVLEIGDLVNSLLIEEMRHGSISLIEGGSVESGYWRRQNLAERRFGPVSGAGTLYTPGSLRAMNWKEGEQTKALLPTEEAMEEAAGITSENETVQMDVGDSSLNTGEEEVLEEYLATQELSMQDVASVFEATVSRYSIDNEGILTKTGDITELNNPVQVDVNNPTNGEACFVVRLHEDANGNITADTVSETTGGASIPFASGLFSKYAIVAANGSAPAAGWDYEYEPDEQTLIISGTGMVALEENETAPWLEKYNHPEIRRIVINSGITGIGANVFGGLSERVRVDFLQSSYPQVDENAFGNTDVVCRYYTEGDSWPDSYILMPHFYQNGALTYGPVSYKEDNHTGWSVVIIEDNNREATLTPEAAREVLIDSRSVALFGLPTAGNETETTAFNAVMQHIEAEYWSLRLEPGCNGTLELNNSTCNLLPYEIIMSANGLTLTVNDSRTDGLDRLWMYEGQATYHGNIQNLKLEGTREGCIGAVTVYGQIGDLDYYGAESVGPYAGPYTGTLQVQGGITRGTVYGDTVIQRGNDSSKQIAIANGPARTFGGLTFSMLTTVINTAETPDLKVNSQLTTVDISNFTLRYNLIASGNDLRLFPKEGSGVGSSDIAMDLPNTFTLADIFWGEDTTVNISNPVMGAIALSGEADGTGGVRGLGTLEITGGADVDVNCPIGHIGIQPDPVNRGSIELDINAAVRSIYIQPNNCIAAITVNNNGSVQSGNFRLPLRDIRSFGTVNGSANGTILMNDNALRVMSWKNSSGTHAILPSDNEVAQAWGGSGKAMIDLTDGNVQELTDEEMSVLATATGEDAQTLRKRIAKVFDLSVTSYTEANGNYSIGENISSMATAVPITISNDAGTDIMVVGLHRNGVALSANVLDGNATTITEDTIGFRTSEFSKYLVISNVDAPDYTNSYDYYFGTAGYQDGSIYGTDSIGYYYAPGIGPNGLGNSQPDWNAEHLSGPDCFTLEKERADYEGSRTLMPNGTAMTDNTTDVYLITCTNAGQTLSWRTTIHMQDGSELPKRMKLNYAEFDMATGRMSGEWKTLGSTLEAEIGKTYKVKCEVDGELPEELEGGTSFYDANWAEETKLRIINAWDNGQYANQLAANEALVTVPATGEYVLCVDTSFWPSDYQSNVQNNLQSRWYVAVECWTADTPAFAEPDISVEICDDEYDSVLISLPWVDGASTHDISIYKPDRTMVYASTWGQGDMQADKCMFQVNIVQGGQNRLMYPGEYYAEITLKGDGYRTTRFRRNFIVTGTGYSFNGFVIPSGTTSIEAEAFAGIPATMVKIPDACTSIGSKAFDGSGLKAVYIPSESITIANDALPAGTLVYTPKGSDAAGWAATNGYEVIFTSKEPK